jgi:phosphotriesterase-related protein
MGGVPVNPATAVRTVLGDVTADRLGVTDAHDHLFFRSPALPGQELDDMRLATAEAHAYAAAGGSTVVQWTPRGLGRRRGDLAAIATATRLHIVAATGRHRAVHHDPAEAGRSADDLAGLFVDDITAATHPCGLVKVGTGYHHLDPFERVSLHAAATAHARTGVPVAIHLELGTAGDLVLAELGGHGVPPASTVLGHVGRNPDDGALLDLAASGAFLCFDGPSRANHPTDWRTPALIELLSTHGHLDQILVGGDTTTAAARSVTSGPGMPGLLTHFRQPVIRRVGEDAWDAITVANPARALTLRPR